MVKKQLADPNLQINDKKVAQQMFKILFTAFVYIKN